MKVTRLVPAQASFPACCFVTERILSPGTRDQSRMASGFSSDKNMQVPPLIPRQRDKETSLWQMYLFLKVFKKVFKNFLRHYSKQYNVYEPAQRSQWKIYKQYTTKDIVLAIKEVKKGKSRSRTSIYCIEALKNKYISVRNTFKLRIRTMNRYKMTTLHIIPKQPI